MRNASDAIDLGMKWKDMSSEERQREYSRRIKLKVMNWMGKHTNELFESLEDIHDEAANWLFKCSSTTARRWVRQLSARGEMYVITEQAAGYVIMLRRDWEASREG